MRSAHRGRGLEPNRVAERPIQALPGLVPAIAKIVVPHFDQQLGQERRVPAGGSTFETVAPTPPLGGPPRGFRSLFQHSGHLLTAFLTLPYSGPEEAGTRALGRVSESG